MIARNAGSSASLRLRVRSANDGTGAFARAAAALALVESIRFTRHCVRSSMGSAAVISVTCCPRLQEKICLGTAFANRCFVRKQFGYVESSDGICIQSQSAELSTSGDRVTALSPHLSFCRRSFSVPSSGRISTSTGALNSSI